MAATAAAAMSMPSTVNASEVVDPEPPLSAVDRWRPNACVWSAAGVTAGAPSEPVGRAEPVAAGPAGGAVVAAVLTRAAGLDPLVAPDGLVAGAGGDVGEPAGEVAGELGRAVADAVGLGLGSR